ncbi:MAG TPA: arylamine N-acetyltransferase [Caulobacteraceae bacterium]|jgi:N-hydroxyarylamine O-acetyltransferase|nr:arylamine N-acetyltransferase [Caulobacteraceae bacterium]
MSLDFDLDAYCARIGYEGPREPTLAVLRGLHARHPAAIAFETLDPLLGRPVRLDLESLQDKLVRSRRGGYCFEHNALLGAALEALGFCVTPLIARVVWMSPPLSPLSPRNHMLLGIDLPEGPHIADVGFGGHLASAPLKLEVGLEQPTAEALMRIVEAGNGLAVETRLPAGWMAMYRFTLEPAERSDYELSNWYTSTYPGFVLTSNLVAERLTPEVRSSLINTRLTRRYRDARVETVDLADAAALARALDEIFDVEPPVAAEALFAKLPRAAPAA